MIEAALKIIANGFLFNGEDSYLKSSWNLLDFFIVILSILSMKFREKDISMFKIVRLIKVLRPLRMINRNKGLQIQIKALVRSIPSIMHVILICLIFFVIFGIICVS